MVNVFGGNIARRPGNLQVVKKVVVTVGNFKDHIDEIQQSYELGFTPYRLHKNADGTFVTPIRVYDRNIHTYILTQSCITTHWAAKTSWLANAKFLYL